MVWILEQKKKKKTLIFNKKYPFSFSLKIAIFYPLSA